jgi:DNA-binding response OmpR family regulator
VKPHILIVGPERELRIWLRHHLEILYADGQIEDLEPPLFITREPGITAANHDLIVLAVRCGESPENPAAGLELLRRMQRRRDLPPVLVVASGGNELTAVQAMRMGATDYLPRSLLDAQSLATALRAAMRARRPSSRVGSRSSRSLRAGIDPSHLELPQYSILHQLGESSRAAVYLAHSSTLGRNVALKISKPSIDDADECQAFAREYAAISAVHHPSVVEIYDYGFHGGHEFIAMEYFPCGDLKTRLQHPLTITESLLYARRICAALQVIHSAGLIHRDLKPPNVMLRDDGSIVLIDFGLAKGVDAGVASTAIGILRGSPYYMSPEQAQGLTLDARSDLYSAGVILFEMLSGNKPYRGTSAVEVMQQHVHGPRPALPRECSALEALLERLMARDRSQRFADAAAACNALDEAMQNLPSESQPLPAAVSL